MSDKVPNVQTIKELNSKRKAEMVENFKKTKEQWDKANPASVPQQFILSEYLVDNPLYFFENIIFRHTSIKQIKADEKTNARIKMGLEEKPTDIKDVFHDPSTSYVENPQAKSKTEWQNKMKAENVFSHLVKILVKRFIKIWTN